jgi:hypothetical protein
MMSTVRLYDDQNGRTLRQFLNCHQLGVSSESTEL